ncbi:MAG: hypothetical protein PHV06_08100 [bacterium]|nr:hypothetical protein [bacterium]
MNNKSILTILFVCFVILTVASTETNDRILISTKGMEFELGGELEYEYVDTEYDTGIDNPYGHFQLDKFTLCPKIKLSENISLTGLFLFNSATAYCSEAYVIFSGLPLFNSKLKIGLDDRFIDIYPSIKTEGYSLIDTSFSLDDDLGITWYGNYKSFIWYLSVSNGLELSAKSPNEDNSYYLFHDNKPVREKNENKEAGLGLGINNKFNEFSSLCILGFFFDGKLNEDEQNFLLGIDGDLVTDDFRSSFYGGSIEYKIRKFTLAGKYISGNDAELERSGWFAQMYVDLKVSPKSTVTPLVMYGALTNNLEPDPGEPLTWDRDNITVALLTTFIPGLILKTEYYINGEDTGDVDVDNDELLIQLEIKF